LLKFLAAPVESSAIYSIDSPRTPWFATNLTVYFPQMMESSLLPKSEQAMNKLDVFVVSFGIAFFLASERFKRLLSWMGVRKAR
jgi:hypothetical protein